MIDRLFMAAKLLTGTDPHKVLVSPPKPKEFDPSRRDPRWHALDKKLLQKNPYCALCKRKHGCVGHHKVPFHIKPELELVESNIITLGEEGPFNCHLFAGHRGNWKKWFPQVEEFCIWMEKILHAPQEAFEHGLPFSI